MNPAGIHSEGKRGVHQVSHNQTSILHTGSPFAVSQNHNHRRRPIEGISVVSHDGSVDSGQGLNGFLILHHNHNCGLHSHAAGRVLACLQDLCQHLLRNLIRLVGTDAAAFSQCF